MITKHYICTLKSDIVLNAALATEGNMETLDHIPGSNFLGIVADSIYKNNNSDAYDILHTGKVSFGDAIIKDKDGKSYAIPNTIFQDKMNDDIESDKVFLDYLIKDHKDIKEGDRTLQLKQKRSGFITEEGKFIDKVKKTFALKSAQDRETRGSKEGAMFGFESIKAGQKFCFTIQYENDNYARIVEEYLIGDKRIGKSKSAQYGQVEISELLELKEADSFNSEQYTIVYAESNLCFLDEVTIQATFEPTAKQLGFETGKINWSKSQIRTYSYSPWNTKRNATHTERHCIAKGSVIVLDGVYKGTLRTVGEYQAEGLGRILINPSFLEGEGEYFAKVKFIKAKDESSKNGKKERIAANSMVVNTSLGGFLKQKAIAKENELSISEAIHEATKSSNWDLKSKITSSQWGNIRAEAVNHLKEDKSYEALIQRLGFSDSTDEKRKKEIEAQGIITHGKMSEKLWDKQKLKHFKSILDIYSQKVKSDGDKLQVVAKYASEMAKIYIDIKNGKIKNKSND